MRFAAHKRFAHRILLAFIVAPSGLLASREAAAADKVARKPEGLRACGQW